MRCGDTALYIDFLRADISDVELARPLEGNELLVAAPAAVELPAIPFARRGDTVSNALQFVVWCAQDTWPTTSRLAPPDLAVGARLRSEKTEVHLILAATALTQGCAAASRDSVYSEFAGLTVTRY